MLEINTMFDIVKIYGEYLHNGPDYFVSSNGPIHSVKIFLLFDSRGISGGFQGSLINMLVEYFKSEIHMAIVRPINLTTWATLLNIFTLNALKPSLVITNLGFVDFTPKKRVFCKDMLDQVKFTSKDDDSKIVELEEYELSSGVSELLSTIEYSDSYKKTINSFVQPYNVIALKTPIVDPDIKIERSRPKSFFTQLIKTNTFIDSLACKSIDLGTFDERYTYDAVHWTTKANHFIMEKIIENL